MPDVTCEICGRDVRWSIIENKLVHSDGEPIVDPHPPIAYR